MRRLLPLCLVAALGGLPAAAAQPLRFEEIVELLEMGVPERVLLFVLEESEPPSLTAEQWLELRRCGASDAVLLALVGEGRGGEDAVPEVAAKEAASPAPPRETPSAGSSPRTSTEEHYRAFYQDDPEAGRVFVLTNLDEEGNRLGGEVARGRRPNLVTGRSAEEARQMEEEQRAADKRAWEEQQEAASAPEPQAAVILARSSPPALLPESYTRPMAFVGISPYYGFFYPYPTTHLYPPGSSTHNKLYHKGNRAGLGHYQLPAGQIFYNPPYPLAGQHRPRR